MAETAIQWADKVWNPVRGCSRVSRGCEHCYAEGIAARFSAGPGDGAKRQGEFAGFAKRTPSGPRWTGKVELLEHKLLEPLRWRKPCRVFVNSMSDLFHEKLSREAIDRVFAVMALCQHLTFQILTKRPERMRAWFQGDGRPRAGHVYNRAYGLSAVHGRALHTEWPLPNVWLGVSVEDRKNKARIDLLRKIPAAVRFLSIEPQLEDLGDLNLDGISWVIIGGESGPGARPFDVAWARDIIAQCKAAGVACFVKQLGKWPEVDWDNESAEWPIHVEPDLTAETSSYRGVRLRSLNGGDPDEWPEDLRVREFPRKEGATA